jgi:hypothetical protein
MDKIKAHVGALWGALAMAGAVAIIALYWISPYLVEPNNAFLSWLGRYCSGVVILLLGFTHVFVILSQAVSEGGNLTGRLAVIVLWPGLLLSAVVDHFL